MVMLHAVLVWKELSVKIKKRFPTDDHVVKVGLMTKDEQEIFKGTTSLYGRWFVPISWVVNLLSQLNKNGIISDVGLQKLVDELYAFRSANGMLTIFDWINAPLRYTQVATFATYGYFTLCLVGRQSIHGSKEAFTIDLYFPFVTILEFIFYVGWLKVAEEYRVPFGEDDDDFDMNYILDRDFHVGNMLIDELAAQDPKPTRDRYWGIRCPQFPHTKASAKVADEIPNWRLYRYQVPTDEQGLVNYPRDSDVIIPMPDEGHDDESPPTKAGNEKVGMRKNAEEHPLVEKA